ncbi:MAG: hypothetical protein JWO99_850 [Candidatus Saccharibacteria bacterium]|nr:hypothetical protein [Candidatus Saccharibacteria bacterium]
MNRLSKLSSKLFGATTYIIAIAIVATLLSGATHTQTHAIAVTGFNPGRIIDNGIFINSTTMNPSQIQNFLVSKVPVCDTNGTQTSEFGGGTRAQWGAAHYGQSTFTCLRDYSEGGKTAAQIIYDAAQTYQINPQVLLVLLQKEQSLVTDTWPLNIQYQSATGYGCPDTAACDSQYYGLTNQINWSAKMFRAILNNSPTWYTPYILGSNNIQYNPNSSCGSSVVNIENRATQALYNYTPYQPNAYAQNGGTSSAYPNCGAFGNLNFYYYFTQWFGSTIKPSLPECPTTDFDCVWGFRNNATGQYFYTSDYNERSIIYQLNYDSVGIVFFGRKSSTVGAVPIYRLHATDGSYLWTASTAEKASLISTGSWTDEGIGFYQDPIASNTGAAVHRLYIQSGLGIHILTANPAEISRLVAAGYTDEGISFTTPTTYYPENPAPTGYQLVYRVLMKNEHFWTTSVVERDALIAAGGKYESVAWQTTTTQTVPVYRLYSPKGEHFWTTSTVERDAILRFGWKLEGISWYTNATGSPTYRFYNTHSGQHFWTTSETERSTLLTSSDWVSEGIAWYE